MVDTLSTCASAATSPPSPVLRRGSGRDAASPYRILVLDRILIGMAQRQQSDLGETFLACLKRNAKETARLEYKREVDVSDRTRKAEFVRDVIALANSEGEIPRKPGHLVLGFLDGEFFDVRSKQYEASAFGKVLDAYISPTLSYDYDEFSNGQRGRFGVLTIRPKATTLYVVRKDLEAADRRRLLSAGQSWGRRADRKQALTGDDIHARWKDIALRQGDSIRKPLKRRIEKLETESGPVLEIKRQRYALERTRDWSETQKLLERLAPYVREFDGPVRSEVMEAITDVTNRTRYGMTPRVASAVSGLLDEMMPLAGGGFNRPAARRLRKTERELLKRIGNRVFELTWDSCRYLRQIEIARIASMQYWQLIRFAKLNGLTTELNHFLEEARRCQEICLEGGVREAFLAGHEFLGQQIEDALAILDEA